MAARSRNTQENFDFTKNEVSKIQKALKDEKFVKLLADYARELNDPETKKRYEAEITQLENERGFNVTFVHPTPGYVLKVVEVNTKKKVFVNICSEKQVDKPISEVGSEGGQTGLKWSIPYSLSQPREDIENQGAPCTVFDVIFHPDTLYLASKDGRIKELVHATALDALKTSFNVNVDRSQVVFPKLKFKGIFRPTVIRKPIQPSAMETMTKIDESGEKDVVCPKYIIRYRSCSDIQDHIILPKDEVLSSRPKELVVEVELPLLDSAAGVDLDVQEQSLCLKKETKPKHYLLVTLPYPVDEDQGTAKFDKSRKTLSVSLPVKLMKAERLSSNDSGIGLDEHGLRNRDSVESMEEVKKSPGCENSTETSPQGSVENCEDSEGSIENPQLINEYRTNVKSVLDQTKSYIFPNFTHFVQDKVIMFTLEAKNVSPQSIEYSTVQDKPAVQLMFTSIGAGQFPVYYAFYLEFKSTSDSTSFNLEDLQVECWDNNIVLQVPYSKGLTVFRVGLEQGEIKEKEYVLEKTGRTELNLRDEDLLSKTKKPKYLHEKHPKKMMKKEEKVEDEDEDEKRMDEGPSSGESLDSSFSVSPMDRIRLDDTAAKTEESEDEEINSFCQSLSETDPGKSEGVSALPPRGILKRRRVQLVPGTRFRCYSESTASDQDWVARRLGSPGAKLVEEKGVPRSKTVRFSEKVHQQLYRINSTIVAKTAKNKKKAEKKRRAVERRMSEGDSMEPLEHSNLHTSSSLDSRWRQEAHEDSGLASSFEETVVIQSETGKNVKVKTKRRTKKRCKNFEMSSDLIFDLDI